MLAIQVISDCLEQGAEDTPNPNETSSFSGFSFFEKPQKEIVDVVCTMAESADITVPHSELSLCILVKTGILQQVAVSYLCVDEDHSWSFQCKTFISHNTGVLEGKIIQGQEIFPTDFS